ncbi:MAG: DUF2802 domain-containing protein [Deltaproteobacteria bacterium]|nr:DUF2802 domain-containing protein [Deltaproteobacteria bacterium]
MILESTLGNHLILLLIMADLAVCAVVLFYLFGGRKRQGRSGDTGKLQETVSSLGVLLRESDRASKNLIDALHERNRRTEELLTQMDSQEKRIVEAIRRAEKLTLELEHSDISGMYREVSRLGNLGLDADEIAKRVKLPRGEIDLILGLKR